MKLSICSHLCRLLCLCLLFLAATSLAQAQQSSRPATGLRPPTAQEWDWMDRNMAKTERVRPNRLGLDRINAHRRSKGLPEVTAATVPLGQESQATTQSGGSAGMDLTTAAGTAASTSISTVPSSVDNSTLASFPPVRNQGSLGSCAAFSTTYYAGTHMLGLARGWNNKSDSDNTRKLSPKWTYNLINDGQDGGSWFSSIMDVLLKLGGPFWADFPYVGSSTPSTNYMEWSRDAAIWRGAISNRFQQVGRVQSVDTSAGLANLKALLANGYVLLYATDIYGWQFTAASDDPSTTADNALVGRKVCWMVTANSSGHAMTIVGYNDDIWVDLNKNGVVDSGEKGALKVVNSWGPYWTDSGSTDGYGWISYDALKATSAVSGVSNTGRASGYRSAFWGSEVYWMTARSSYTPTLLGQFTVSSSHRDQLNLRLGSSSTSTTTPESYFPTTTTYGWQNSSGWPQVFQNLGGGYAFNGGYTAVSGTFVFDLTDLVQTGNRRYYVSVADNAYGYPASLTDFRLTTPTGALLATAASGIPGSADGATALAYADFTVGLVPVITSGSTASGVIGQSFSFSVTASNGATSFGATGLPLGLSIDSGSGLISGTPTQAGTYNVGLSAANSSGVGTGTLVLTISSQQIAAPVISSSVTTTGTVGLPFSYTIIASNSPTSFGATGLPPGLSVNANSGVISGTPTQAGSFSATITASNAGGTGTRTLSMTVASAPAEFPVITSSGTATGLSGSPFSYRIQATNNATSFDAQNLPAGLSVNTTTGDITGTLPAPAVYDITLVATNGYGSGYLHLTLTVTGNNIYGPPNDSFSTPVVLSGNSASSSGNNINATVESGEPSHSGTGVARCSVWWRWTAPSSGSVTIQTAGSTFDTVLAVYTGSAVNALARVAFDDNSGPSGTSLVIFNAVGGVTYQIAVDGVAGATGQIALSLALSTNGAPANDDFANRTLLSGTSVSTAGGNTGGTAETGEPSHVGYTAMHSVWWTWTAPVNGLVSVDTIGSDFDTLLSVYTGSSLNALVSVAEDDQGGGNNTSKVTFMATAGTVYQIAVDGWSGDTGAVQLHVAVQGGAPSNDMFADRSVITGSSITASGNNTNATAEINEPNHNGFVPRRSVWWSWTAPSSGAVVVDTEGSSFDTVLAVYTGSGLPSLTKVASDDDSGAGTTSQVSFYAVAGRTYQIAVDGYGGAAGTVTLHVALTTQPLNNNFSNRITLSGSTASTIGSNINASSEPGEPSHDNKTAQKSVWWTWTAPGNGPVAITTDGSDFDTVLAVYTGSSLLGLSGVISNDDFGGGSTSSVSFYATAGTVYQIAVDGYDGAEGLIDLGISQSASLDLYSTNFEDFPSGVGALDGNDGWIGTDDPSVGSYGILSFGSQAAWVGFNPTSAADVFAYRPVNYDPVTANTPNIRFSTDVTIEDSTNSNYDQFGFALFNMNGDYLTEVCFDESNLKIYCGDGNGGLSDTGTTFTPGQSYKLVVTMNFATNRWSATLDGTVLFSNRTIRTGKTLNLGDMDAFWDITYQGSPGDNYMIFDNYKLSIDAPVQTPDAPSNLTVGSIRKTSTKAYLTLNFTDNSDNEDYFYVYAKRLRPNNTWTKWAPIQVAAGHMGTGSFQVQDLPLARHSKYRLRISGANAAGMGLASPTLSVNTR